MNQNVSYTFNLEEWEKKPRKPFNIKKTWSRSKPAVVSAEETAGETFENFTDSGISPIASPVHLHTPSPAKDLIKDGSHQQSSKKALTKGLDSSSTKKKKTPESRELRGVLENMPSLRKSPLSARRRNVPDGAQQSSSSRSQMITPKTKESRKETETVEKPKQKLSIKSQPHFDAGDDRVTIGKKRNLVISNSSDKKKPTKHVRRSTPITDEESESMAVPDQMVDLWTCSNHVQRKKSDLCEIDIVMSSLRDAGYEMFEESDDEVEQKAIRQVVKKSLESLWKLVKESTVNKNRELELKKVTKELSKARTELLAKGKERNQELMKLSELQQKTKELAQYEEAGSSKDVTIKFNTLKQNLPTISE